MGLQVSSQKNGSNLFNYINIRMKFFKGVNLRSIICHHSLNLLAQLLSVRLLKNFMTIHRRQIQIMVCPLCHLLKMLELFIF